MYWAGSDCRGCLQLECPVARSLHVQVAERPRSGGTSPLGELYQRTRNAAAAIEASAAVRC